MSVKQTVDDCSSAIMERGLDDWVDAAEVAWVARSVGGASGDDETRDLSIAVIRNVLTRGWMTIGDVTTAGYTPWRLDVEASVKRVSEAWKKSSRPRLGDVCWLSNTELGDEVARGLP